jgi:hypothetical protein
LHTALLELSGDRPTLNAECLGEIGPGAAGLVLGHEVFDRGCVQAALDRSSIGV